MKRVAKKLKLNKQSVSELNTVSMNSINGGTGFKIGFVDHTSVIDGDDDDRKTIVIISVVEPTLYTQEIDPIEG